MMNIDKSFDKSLFSIRFIGNDFEERGVSIYDLSSTFISFQRIIHKAHLSLEGRLNIGTFPKIEERQMLALQIGERKRKSDAFSLLPILSDPTTHEYMLNLADHVLAGMIGYYTGKVLNTLETEKNPIKKLFISSIYPEISDIVNRIEAAGGVEGISIGSPIKNKETIVSFTSETKNYLQTIKDQYYLGDYMEIEGSPYKLYPNSRIVSIKNGRKSIDIHLNQEDFDHIRFTQVSKADFLFKGRPRYHLGVKTPTIRNFEAISITYLPK